MLAWPYQCGDREPRLQWGGMNEVPQTLALSAFKHTLVPIGVIIGLGVARIVMSVSLYIKDRDRVRFSLTHTIWTSLLFLLFVGLWWGLGYTIV